MPNKLLLSPLCGWVLRSAMLHYGPKARRLPIGLKSREFPTYH